MTDARFTDDETRTDRFHHRSALLWGLIGLITPLLLVLLFAVFYGPGFDPASNDPYLAVFFGVMLFGLVALCLWLLRRRPVVMTVGPEGILLPIAFSSPLPWSDIHRIRRVRSQSSLTGARDWLIIDPSPGVLAPLRLPVWRRLELWFQRKHGVRVPLHGLDADGDLVVRSVERFRPVTEARD